MASQVRPERALLALHGAPAGLSATSCCSLPRTAHSLLLLRARSSFPHRAPASTHSCFRHGLELPTPLVALLGAAHERPLRLSSCSRQSRRTQAWERERA